MCTRSSLQTFVVAIAFASLALHADRAAADPVGVSGFLSGQPRFALIEQELDLTFPGFSLILPSVSPLKPNFCFDGCGNGTAVPFTQTTGAFSDHSTAQPFGGVIDADVSGVLSFVGPTDFVSIGPDRGASDVLTKVVKLSGLLKVTQGNLVLFNGTLVGTGTATVLYVNRFGAFDTRLDGYQFTFNAIAATPEPASIVLVCSGAGWLVRRRRNSARA
jgi:hypothetical protein